MRQDIERGAGRAPSPATARPSENLFCLRSDGRARRCHHRCIGPDVRQKHQTDEVRATNGEVAIDQNVGFHQILLGWPSADDSYDVADGVRKERIKIRAGTGENSMKPIRIYFGSC